MRAILLSLAFAIPAASHAQQTVQALPGYGCAMLNMPAAAMANPANLPPVLSAPSATAPRVGVASTTVIVASPTQAMNGYVRVLHLDGRPGWIEAARLKPWRAEAEPTATCTPVRRADGRIGFR